MYIHGLLLNACSTRRCAFQTSCRATIMLNGRLVHFRRNRLFVFIPYPFPSALIHPWAIIAHHFVVVRTPTSIAESSLCSRISSILLPWSLYGLASKDQGINIGGSLRLSPYIWQRHLLFYSFPYPSRTLRLIITAPQWRCLISHRLCQSLGSAVA